MFPVPLGYANSITSLLSGAQLGFRARAQEKKHCPGKKQPCCARKKNIAGLAPLPDRARARGNIDKKKTFWVGDAPAAATTKLQKALVLHMVCKGFIRL